MKRNNNIIKNIYYIIMYTTTQIIYLRLECLQLSLFISIRVQELSIIYTNYYKPETYLDILLNPVP